MRLTLVTPTFNAERYLAEALQSVRAQGWPDLEHIVVDGGSTDRTLDLVRGTPQTRVVSEPDDGLVRRDQQGSRASPRVTRSAS